MKQFSLMLAVWASLYLAFLPVSYAGGGHEHTAETVELNAKGPNGGKLLVDGDMSVELVLFERGVPPEYRLYVRKANTLISPQELSAKVLLKRLGGQVDDISFLPQGDFLRGDQVVYEPHSFEVEIQVVYRGKTYHWHFENFEGRTKIADDMAKKLGVETAKVGPQTLANTILVYGKTKLPPNAQRHISARYPGKITALKAFLGQNITKGQHILTIESDESLQAYKLYAPISGVVTGQYVSQGEQTGEQVLLEITNTRELVVEFAVYPKDQKHIRLGNPVNIADLDDNTQINASLTQLLPRVNTEHAKLFRATIDNKNNSFSIGQFVKGQVTVEQFDVPLAVKTKGLQQFRDFTVVYEKIGDTYEVRMLQLGRISGDWVEVLSGITAGSDYVESNSFLIKADIEKSGAAHDH